MFFFGINIFRGFLGLLMFPLAIWAGWWTYKDVTARGGRYNWIWAGISFSVFPLGFIFYLIYRVFTKTKV
ncbi:MAG: hypothetical protein RO469_15350 [Thermincola sp.]|nr:hypothetical protein [Thermincola sp.]MDT3702797.1 hypothetical protein [Thermincola sp.]